MKNQNLNQHGSILLGLVLMLPWLILITALFLELATTSLKLAQKDQFHTHAQLATDAGIDFAMYQINKDENWAGTGGQVELHNDGNVKTTYEISVTNNNADSKTITSIGRTFRPATSTTAQSTITIKTDLRPVRSDAYSVVTGVGGLYMSNSAKILGGNVHVNGEIQMSNTAQIGLTNNPVALNVAHQNCPEPATAAYPRLCNSGESGQPIAIYNTAHIYGDVKANNQISSAGMTNPGLTASSGVAALPLPPYDRNAQKAAVTANQTGTMASCSGNTTKTWPANLKITGDVNISNNCQVTVSGNVWITGKLTLSNQGKLIVSDALGTTRPTIMVDGSATAVNLTNNTELKPNSIGTGFQIITYWSRASCSPDCDNVTGTSLYNSRNDTTIDMNNSSNAGATILYARWTRVSVSNSGQIGALIGQTVQLNNSATITFGASAGSSSTQHWIIDGYRRTFN
jgi:hypothetical protein